MNGAFVAHSSNPLLRDAARAKGQAMLELFNRQTADVGEARGYLREGKPFEAGVIIGKYGSLAPEDQFDPRLAAETSQRSQLLGQAIDALAKALPLASGMANSLVMRNFTFAELQGFLKNKEDIQFAYEDFRKQNALGGNNLSDFFASPQFRVLGTNYVVSGGKFTGTSAEIAAQLINDQLGKFSDDINDSIDTGALQTNVLLQQLVDNGYGAPPVGVAAPVAFAAPAGPLPRIVAGVSSSSSSSSSAPRVFRRSAAPPRPRPVAAVAAAPVVDLTIAEEAQDTAKNVIEEYKISQGDFTPGVYENMPLPPRGITAKKQRVLDYCHLSWDLFAQLPPEVQKNLNDNEWSHNSRYGPHPFRLNMLQWKP